MQQAITARAVKFRFSSQGTSALRWDHAFRRPTVLKARRVLTPVWRSVGSGGTLPQCGQGAEWSRTRTL